MATEDDKAGPTDTTDGAPAQGIGTDYELEATMYARHVEANSLNELAGDHNQRGTPIPALFHQFYKFIQNPSTVSVETFKRMVDTDDTVGSGVDFLTTCLAGRLGRFQHPSEEITEWVNNRLDEIKGGWFNVVKEVLSAVWAGYSVSEKVWANTENGFIPQKVVTLPPSTVLFETDRAGEITQDGILQYQRNFNPVTLAQGIGFYGGAASSFGFNSDIIRPDLYAKFGDLPFPIRSANTYNYLSIRIPKIKTIHYAFDAQGKFNNPYGRSLLRRAYKYYVMKDTVLKMMSVALDRKGTPLTIVYADPNTTLKDGTKYSQANKSKSQARGQSVGIDAPRAAADAFKKIHNDTTIVLPGMKGKIFDTDFVPQDSNTESFIQALDFCNKSILRSLLVPALIFNSGDGSGSYALGQEHSKTFEKILDGMLAGANQVLIEQLVKEMIAYNFPSEYWKKDGFGSFGKREFTDDEMEKMMNTYEKAVNMGVIDLDDLSDLNKIRDAVGFEARQQPIERQDDFDFTGMFGDQPPEKESEGGMGE